MDWSTNLFSWLPCPNGLHNRLEYVRTWKNCCKTLGAMICKLRKSLAGITIWGIPVKNTGSKIPQICWRNCDFHLLESAWRDNDWRKRTFVVRVEDNWFQKYRVDIEPMFAEEAVFFIFQIVQRGKLTLSYGVEGLTRIVQRGCQLCGQPLSTQQKLNHGKVPLKSVHKFTCIVKWATQLPSPLLLRFKKDGWESNYPHNAQWGYPRRVERNGTTTSQDYRPYCQKYNLPALTSIKNQAEQWTSRAEYFKHRIQFQNSNRYWGCLPTRPDQFWLFSLPLSK